MAGCSNAIFKKQPYYFVEIILNTLVNKASFIYAKVFKCDRFLRIIKIAHVIPRSSFYFIKFGKFRVTIQGISEVALGRLLRLIVKDIVFHIWLDHPDISYCH